MWVANLSHSKVSGACRGAAVGARMGATRRREGDFVWTRRALANFLHGCVTTVV